MAENIDDGGDIYSPIMIEIPLIGNINFATEKLGAKLSRNVDYPKFEYGLNHYVHDVKETMEITEKFKEKKKVYLVVNPFETRVDDYENTIENVTKYYLGLNDIDVDIVSRGFYKIWEIYMMFDIIPVDKSNFISVHLAEGPGSFVQATMYYRDKYITGKNNTKNDKYYAVTIFPENANGSVPDIADKFVKHHAKEKPQRLFVHKTYSKQIAGKRKDIDNGDITEPKTIKLFEHEIVDKADIITADGGFDWTNETIQEQEAYRLLLGEILAGITYQKKGGSFVLKIFESLTSVTFKIIALLRSLYDNVYAIKPLTSRSSNSEKYLVCKGFNGEDKDVKQLKKQLSILLDKMYDTNLDLLDIYSSVKLNNDFIINMIYLNNQIGNKQLLEMDKIITFIEKGIYYGDEYNTYRKNQINANNYWTNKFLVDKKNMLDGYVDSLLSDVNKKIDKMKTKIII